MSARPAVDDSLQHLFEEERLKDATVKLSSLKVEEDTRQKRHLETLSRALARPDDLMARHGMWVVGFGCDARDAERTLERSTVWNPLFTAYFARKRHEQAICWRILGSKCVETWPNTLFEFVGAIDGRTGRGGGK